MCIKIQGETLHREVSPPIKGRKRGWLKRMAHKKTIPSTTQKGAAEIPKQLKTFDKNEPFAVLATNDGGKPYTSLISFALTPDLRQVIFATPRNTRKFKNITAKRDVALLVDNRSKRKKGFMGTEAITVTGTATTIRRGRVWIEYAGIFLKKHPELEEFVNASTTALIIIDITSCVHVGSFQIITVMDWKGRES